MDQLISTVEDLQRELEKVPSSDMGSIQRDMETLRDQWLVVSEVHDGYCFSDILFIQMNNTLTSRRQSGFTLSRLFLDVIMIVNTI